jgi:hypothetical protein
MRWDAFFEDMEAQFAAARAAAGESGANDLLRVEHGRVTLADRLSAHLAHPLRVKTLNGHGFAGRLSHVGAEWLVLEGGGQSVLVPYAALQSVEGLGRGVGPGPTGVHARLGLASAFRALARDRAYVSVFTGSPVSVHEGTVDRVGRDFLELALVPSGEQRRAGNVVGVLALPFAAVTAVASQP